MVAAFEFYGAVAQEVWWDNPKTVATLILQRVYEKSVRAYNST
jgi:transposase